MNRASQLSKTVGREVDGDLDQIEPCFDTGTA